jgi:hypothetical protein
MLTFCVAVVLCDSPRWSWLTLAGAILAATIGSYSSLQGLLIWPAGLVVLLLRRRRGRFLLVWVAAAVVTTAIYFQNYDPQLGGNNLGYTLHHPLQGLRFFLFSVGNVMDSHSGNLAVVLGLFIVLTALWLSFLVAFRPRENDTSPLGVGLICFGLLFAATVTAGRASPILDAGGATRYTTFDLLTLVGCYLVLLSRRTQAKGDRRFDQIAWYGCGVTVSLAVSLMLILGTINGLDDASSLHNAQIPASRVIANIKRAPDSMVERVLVGNPWSVPYARQMTAFARENRLTFFASPSTVDRYVRAGLPYDAKSLSTTVEIPRSGAAVKGVVVLIASAQSDFGVSKVGSTSP